jgi:hypothetical protein
MFENQGVIGNVVVKASDREVQLGVDGLGALLKTMNNEDFRINAGINTRFFLHGATGNISIGSSVGQERLHVFGRARFEEGIKLGNSQGENVLNHYEEFNTTTNISSNGNVIATNVQVKLVRIGKSVTLTVPANVLNITPIPVTELLFSFILPDRFRPANNALRFPIQVLNNDVQGTGILLVNTTGIIGLRPNVSNPAGQWFGINNCGFYAFSVQYVL